MKDTDLQIKTRRRFAWLPAEIERMGKTHREYAGYCIWLRTVTEKKNMWFEWVAWDYDNPKPK